MRVKYTNNQTTESPQLLAGITMGNCKAIPGIDPNTAENNPLVYERIVAAGYQLVQEGNPKLCQEYGLLYAAGGRCNTPGDLDESVKQWIDDGAVCATLHVGWGMEDDHEALSLIEYILNTSGKNDFPIYIETHRSTITQDMWRTVQFTNQLPEIRFNGDFSHWYTGLEMVYGDFDAKLEFIQPVLERVAFMHGRIGNPSHMQVAIPDTFPAPFVKDFMKVWSKIFQSFKEKAKSGDYLTFAPELLGPEIYYARAFQNDSGEFLEETDRWEEAEKMMNIARSVW